METTTIITNLLREGGVPSQWQGKIIALNQIITSQCPMDPMVMGCQRMEKSKELRLLYYLRIYGNSGSHKKMVVIALVNCL